jgi:hypothetical protein
MAHQEETTFPGVLQPLVTIVAEKEIYRVWVIVVGIHESEANGNTNNRERTKQDVRQEKNLCLLLEELPIVPEPVDVLFWHVIQVDQIVEPVQA